MMNLWTDPRRVRRALVALVLIPGQFAATAAARPSCDRAHDAAAPRTQVEATVAAAASPQGAAAVERSATAVHDHAPRTPSAPGASPCTTLVAAVLPAEEDAVPVETVIPVAAAEQSFPTSISTPPPYDPPRA